jgi:L,D-peptidoglycan transpeptidase YkuD (ErfK/YbiS/YcfS/YnhG family)
MSAIEVYPNNTLAFQEKIYQCSLGRHRIGSDKKEGDGKTPSGVFPLRLVYFRPDKFEGIETGLPTKALDPTMGWSDDVNKSEYNQEVKLPYEGSHEKLWHADDDLYDLVVVVGYNDNPPVSGKGSAIFMHIARPGYSSTEGCVALSKNDLLEILSGCDKNTVIKINQ